MIIFAIKPSIILGVIILTHSKLTLCSTSVQFAVRKHLVPGAVHPASEALSNLRGSDAFFAPSTERAGAVIGCFFAKSKPNSTPAVNYPRCKWNISVQEAAPTVRTAPGWRTSMSSGPGAPRG